MSERTLNTQGATSPAEILDALARAGIEPMANPRDLTHKAAMLALEHIFPNSVEADISHDLRVAARLVATIITINGPGRDNRH